MNALILDCSYGMNVFVISDEDLYFQIDRNQKKHTDELLVSVNKLLEKANISAKDLDNICVCVGPGSFTGIRVAVSICKGLAIGTGAKIFTANNFEILNYKNESKAVFVLEGFSEYVYVRVFDGENCFDNCERISELTEKIKKDYSDYNVYVQSNTMQELLKGYEIKSDIAENNVVDFFDDKILNNLFTEINQISPIYLRASQAELERAEKLKKEELNAKK